MRAFIFSCRPVGVVNLNVSVMFHTASTKIVIDVVSKQITLSQIAVFLEVIPVIDKTNCIVL